MAEEQLPAVFGPFTLEKRLGEGGFAVVYRATDRRFKTPVALKRASTAWLGDPRIREQFTTSVAVSRTITHPRVCQVFDHGILDGVPYLTMPIYPGGSLRNPRRVRDPWDAVTVVHGLAWTMHEVHRQRVVHLDLKPENVLYTADDQAIIVDFGCALRLDLITQDQLRENKGVGTLHYMAPEQLVDDTGLSGGFDLGTACDIWALGVILYELLAGQPPFNGYRVDDLVRAICRGDPPPPSQFRPVPPELDALCTRALSSSTADRFRSMEAFADALVAAYDRGWVPQLTPEVGARPVVPPSAIRYVFAGHGSVAPRLMPADRLFLDVGGDLRPGVIDHHQRVGGNACTARLVLDHPECIDQAVAPDRDPDAPFTILLHQDPDMDCVVSALFARSYLARREFPEGAEHLAEYVNWLDTGGQSDLPAFRASLYVAYQIAQKQLGRQEFASPQERWDAELRRGMELTEQVLQQALAAQSTIGAVDAFTAAGEWGRASRREVEEDERRYERTLREPKCQARVGQLWLPDRNGFRTAVDVLLIRNVFPEVDRCEMLKVWARADAVHSPSRRGFVALSVFLPAGPERPQRCIVSVKPDAPVTLEGLGALLEHLEHERRLKGSQRRDAREEDPLTGARLPDRPGYPNPDPWYDGRAHDYTIIDSPRCGTVLTADEIEAAVLEFGKGQVGLVGG